MTLPSAAVALLPTPTAMQQGGTAEQHLERKRRAGINPTVTDLGLLITSGGLERTLPTPKASDGAFGMPRTSGRTPDKATHLATRLHHTDFGIYRAAIERWEQVTGVPCPPPTIPNTAGNPRLNPAFSEWMMGLPAGWVTDPAIWEGVRPVPAINAQLKMCGNGVVPQQAEAAIVALIDRAGIIDRLNDGSSTIERLDTK